MRADRRSQGLGLQGGRHGQRRVRSARAGAARSTGADARDADRGCRRSATGRRTAGVGAEGGDVAFVLAGARFIGGRFESGFALRIPGSHGRNACGDGDCGRSTDAARFDAERSGERRTGTDRSGHSSACNDALDAGGNGTPDASIHVTGRARRSVIRGSAGARFRAAGSGDQSDHRPPRTAHPGSDPRIPHAASIGRNGEASERTCARRRIDGGGFQPAEPGHSFGKGRHVGARRGSARASAGKTSA